MLTYTTKRNLFGTLSNDKSDDNLTVGDTLINNFEKQISKKYNFLESSVYSSTVASQQFYELPNNFGKIKNVTVTIGTTKYSPKRITSREQWDNLNSATSTTSDIPEYYYIFNKQIGFYPTPSSATTDAIYLQYHIRLKDSSVADYTTGSIVSVANGGTAVVGTGTSWTAKMAGMWLQIADSGTANTGDGEWYEIESVESSTALTLRLAYQGIAIVAGTASYTIGQASYLPEDFQMLPVFQALEVYFTSIKPDNTKRIAYAGKVAEMKQGLMEEYGSNSIDPTVSEDDTEMRNPNNYIEGT
jgi:hypothetical protein